MFNSYHAVGCKKLIFYPQIYAFNKVPLYMFLFLRQNTKSKIQMDK